MTLPLAYGYLTMTRSDGIRSLFSADTAPWRWYPARIRITNVKLNQPAPGIYWLVERKSNTDGAAPSIIGPNGLGHG